MKKLIAFLAIAAMQLTPAMATVGGPWSNNTFDSHIDGMYSGIMYTKNGTGIIRFSQSQNAQASAFSMSMLYHKGLTYSGSCQCNIDSDSKQVAGMTNGSAYNRSPLASGNQSPPINDNNPSFSGNAPARTPAVWQVPLAGNPNLFVPPGNQVNSGSRALANSYWTGKLTNTVGTIRFKANGMAAFIGDNDIIWRVTSTQASDGTQTSTQAAVNTGSNITSTVVQVSTGGNDRLPEPRNKVPVHVFGSRISYTLQASFIGNGLTGTGGGTFSF